MISIIIVNYNGGELILNCIDSIYCGHDLQTFEVIVVDNDSKDNSVVNIKKKFPEVVIVENNQNLGFAAANNIGFLKAKGDYFLLLNPDTTLGNNTLTNCLAYINNQPEVGVLGCKVFWGTGERQSTVMRYPTLSDIVINMLIPNRSMRKSRWAGKSRYVGVDFDHEMDVEVVAGCFMLLPRAVYDEVGGMDEDFFMFGEEVEWCWRINNSGRKVRYYPSASIIHQGGGCSANLSYRKVLLIAKGQLLVFQKTRGRFVAVIANLLMLLRDTPRSGLFWVLLLISREKAESWLALRESSIRLSFLFNFLFGKGKEV